MFEANAAQTKLWSAPAIRFTVLLLAVILQLVLIKAAPNLSVWFAVAMFLAGVPHGAVEYISNEKDGTRAWRKPSPFYCAIYVLIGVVAFSFYIIAPVIGLCAFLAVSALHFGAEETHIKSLGIFVILGSLALYPSLTLTIFDMLSDQTSFSSIPLWTAQIAGLISLGVVAFESILKKREYARTIAIISIFIILPPIQAVAIYFLFFHSLESFNAQTADHTLPSEKISSYPVYIILAALIGASVLIGATYLGYISLPIAAA
ncbi:Brp/Blh family beta-carotene 15,15'-dioxygenase, partial [Hellea sp.]|nr:Brp/Blh family beta-carotene 15,15'-dioxygenase [Hellea sp.]